VTDKRGKVMYKRLESCKNVTIHIYDGLEIPKLGNEETASRYRGNYECTEYVMVGSDKG
jgi:hypothetical protein